MAHDAGALVFVDGVHYAPHFLPDVAALGCDLFACSAYKFHGPHIGVLWGRRELLERSTFRAWNRHPTARPERMETGTQNHEGIVGAAAAVRWLASLAGPDGDTRGRLATTFCEIHEREAELCSGGYGTDSAAWTPWTLHGPVPATKRTATVSFTVRGVDSEQVAVALARHGVLCLSRGFLRLDGGPSPWARVRRTRANRRRMLYDRRGD